MPAVVKVTHRIDAELYKLICALAIEDYRSKNQQFQYLLKLGLECHAAMQGQEILEKPVNSQHEDT